MAKMNYNRKIKYIQIGFGILLLISMVVIILHAKGVFKTGKDKFEGEVTAPTPVSGTYSWESSAGDWTPPHIVAKSVYIKSAPAKELNLFGVIIYNEFGNVINLLNPFEKMGNESAVVKDKITWYEPAHSEETTGNNLAKLALLNSTRKLNQSPLYNMKGYYQDPSMQVYKLNITEGREGDFTFATWGNHDMAYAAAPTDDFTWWRYTFANPVHIAGIEIWGRHDCCLDRTENLNIILENDTGNEVARAIFTSPYSTSGYGLFVYNDFHIQDEYLLQHPEYTSQEYNNSNTQTYNSSNNNNNALNNSPVQTPVQTPVTASQPNKDNSDNYGVSGVDMSSISNKNLASNSASVTNTNTTTTTPTTTTTMANFVKDNTKDNSYKIPRLNIIQHNLTGASNIFSPVIYVDVEPFESTEKLYKLY